MRKQSPHLAFQIHPYDGHTFAAAATPEEAEARLAAILAILLAYGAHDYAADIIAAARRADVIEPEAADASG